MFEKLFDLSGLSLERLHALIRLADEGSLIRAAKGGAGVQSRYSHHIKELSAYFGIELTERVGKTVRLTASGKILLRLASTTVPLFRVVSRGLCNGIAGR